MNVVKVLLHKKAEIDGGGPDIANGYKTIVQIRTRLRKQPKAEWDWGTAMTE